VATWYRARMVTKIAEVASTSEDRVREVILGFNDDDFVSCHPKYKGGGRRLTRCLSSALISMPL
jgi:hypothetical protein